MKVPTRNIVKLTDGSHDCVFTNNQQVNAACGYTYDAMYRLTAAAGREHVALAQNADTDATAFLRSAWAHLNNSQQLVNYTENYLYDTAGNLTQVQHAGASTYTRYIDIDTTSNRGLQRPDQGQPDFVSSFDANGNQVLMGHVDSLAWDYQDRLQKVVLVPRENDQDDAEWYVYDGAGQRVRKVRETVGYGGDVVTIEEKIYLGDAEIKRIYQTTYDEYDVPTTTKVLDRTSVHVMDDKSRVALVHYWSVDTNLLELDNTNQLNTHRTRYQYGNHLGSASLELDAAGSVISYEEYLPYGGTSFVAGTSQTEVRLKEYRYSAKERDNSTGFYYYGARYYAPWLGRWMSCDPAGPVDGPNLYWFVKGNPVGLVDHKGNEADSWHDATPAAIQVIAYAFGAGFVLDWAEGRAQEITKDPSAANKAEAIFGAPVAALAHELIILTVVDLVAPFAAGASPSRLESQPTSSTSSTSSNRTVSAAPSVAKGTGATSGAAAEGSITTSQGTGAVVKTGKAAENAVRPGGTAALEARAQQIHEALDPVAQKQRTTAVLRTNRGDIVAGGGRDLTPAQRAMLAPGETAAKLPGAHAEVTALSNAQKAGVTPEAIAATRTICPKCVEAIEASGGTITSPTTAEWIK